jgi:hypothetical protein
MSAKAPLEALYEHLSEVPDTTIYAVLDGASAPHLPQTLAQLDVESVCLFRGELDPEVAQVAPYMAVLQPETPFAEWVLQEGWGQHWGIFAISSADFRTMRKHFRTFLMVYDPNLKPLYFRYYDPRVLRVYLPTCNAQELRTVFGPIRRYIVEDEDPQVLLKYQSDGENLSREPVLLG